MENGFVIFVVKKSDYLPAFLRFGLSYDGKLKIDYMDRIEEATVYPIYEAAETVMNQLVNDYFCVKIFDTKGNVCSNEPFSNSEMSGKNKYIRRSTSDDDRF